MAPTKKSLIPAAFQKIVAPNLASALPRSRQGVVRAGGFSRDFPADLFWASHAGMSDDEADAAASRLWAASGIEGSPASSSILDVGCGRGEIARAFGRMGARVMGIDSDPACVAEAQAAVLVDRSLAIGGGGGGGHDGRGAAEFACSCAEEAIPLIDGAPYDFVFCHYVGWGYGGAHGLRAMFARVREALAVGAVFVSETHDAQAMAERFDPNLRYERAGADGCLWTVRCEGALAAPRREEEIGRVDQFWTFVDPDGVAHGPRQVAFEPMSPSALGSIARLSGFLPPEEIEAARGEHATPGAPRKILRFKADAATHKPAESLIWRRMHDAMLARAKESVIVDTEALTGRDCLDFEARLEAILRPLGLGAGMGGAEPGNGEAASLNAPEKASGPHVVAALLPRSWVVPLALMAARGAGLAFLPLDLDAPDSRLRGILERVKPRAVISFEKDAERVAGLVGENAREDKTSGDKASDSRSQEKGRSCFRVLPPGANFETVSVVEIVDAKPLARDASHLVFTSGSTGRPKGVLLQEKGLLAVIDAQIARLPAGPGVSLWMLNPSFDASLSDILCPLLGGKTLRPHRPAATRLRELRAALAQSDTADIPPSMIGHLSPELNGMQGVIFGGERCREEDARTLSRATLGLQAYGPTETSVCVMMAQAADNWTPGLLGTPLLAGTIALETADGTRHAVESATDFDPNGVRLDPAPAQDGVLVGEIIVRGLPVAIGYFDDPEQEAQRFGASSGASASTSTSASASVSVSDSASLASAGASGDGEGSAPGHELREHRTGDIARFENGRLIWVGRKDRQFKRRGRMVCPEEIETHVELSVEGSAASCRMVGDQLVLAVAVAGATVPKDLASRVAESLGSAFRPNRVIMAERMPITTSGKTDWAALLETGHEA